MQIPVQIPAIWVHTTSASLQNLRETGYAAFLTEQQQARLERIRQSNLLFDGLHEQYFLEERRSQFDWAPMRVADRIVQPFIPYNILRLVSYKSADLLFGSEPILRVDNKIQQKFLNDLAARSHLHQLFYNMAVTASYQAEAFIEACIYDGQVYLKEMPADEIFPIGCAGPDGQYARYERMRVDNVGPRDMPIKLLLKEIYLAGSIERRCYQLNPNGTIGSEVDLSQWPLDASEPPLEAKTITGIDRNTIIYVPNQLSRGKAISDYDGAIALQDELNYKQTQIAVVLSKHGMPKMAWPQESADDQGTVRMNYDVQFYTDPERIPKYLTWNSELGQAYADRDFTLSALLQVMEMSPILLGIKGSVGHAEAFRTVRVQAYSAVTRAARKGSFWKDGVRRSLSVAQDLENTIQGIRYDRVEVGVDLQDGLPIDDIDLSNQIATTRSAGAMSLKRSISLQIRDPEAQKAEIAEIMAEEAAKTPSVLIGAPGGGSPRSGGTETPDDDPQDLETQASAAEREELEEVAA